MRTTDCIGGRRVGLSLGVPDVARAAEFYGSVFGWKFESAGPEAGGYGMFTQDGKAVAAAGPATEPGAGPARAGGLPLVELGVQAGSPDILRRASHRRRSRGTSSRHPR